jgi:hypothetical protein
LKTCTGRKKGIAFGGTLADLDPGDLCLRTWTLAIEGLGCHHDIPRCHPELGFSSLEASVSLMARVGIILGLWRPSVSRSLLNVPHVRINVTLEGHDVTLGGVFGCKFILIMSKLIFCCKLARLALFFYLKVNYRSKFCINKQKVLSF